MPFYKSVHETSRANEERLLHSIFVVSARRLIDYQLAILKFYGFHASFLEHVAVEVADEGRTLHFDVLVFEFRGHTLSGATRCYAWEVNGEIRTVLGVPPIDGPREAVEAFLRRR